MELRDDLRDLKPYQAGQRYPGVLKLSSNENPLGPSPAAVATLQAAAAQLHLYPDGAAAELRAALASHLGVTGDQVLVGNGSDEVFTLITGAFFRPGDRAVTAAHTFSEYQFAVRLFGGSMDTVPLRDGAFDLDAARAALGPRTRAVFICSPNNPTGGAVSGPALTAFLDAVPPSLLVVLDEAYVHYADAPDRPDALALLGRYPNLVVTRTFSKLYGLAALRVGYAVGPADLIRQVSVVKQPFNVGTLGQVAARAALGDSEFADRSRAVNAEGKRFWTKALADRALFHYPTQANFVCVRVDRDEQQVFRAMAGAGVTIRPLTSFGLPGWIRITIGTAEQNALCLRALDVALDTIPSRQ